MKVLLHFGLWCAGLANPETQTTEAERNCISRHAAGRHRLAEVGVWHGVTTCRIREAMAADAILFAIDPYPKGKLGFSMHRVIARREVPKIRNGGVEWLRQTGAEAARSLARAKGFDFVFIDGDHSYKGLKEDWDGWSHLVGARGVMALHDSCSTPDRPIDGAGSVQFAREVILRHPSFRVVDIVDSLTVVERKDDC
jgi:predicted O-methyltransferase YrrM